MSCQPSASDVLACLCLAISLFAASLIPFFLLVDADLEDFDPRPLLRRVAKLTPVAVSREFGRDVAALFILLCTSPKGAMAA